MESSDPRQEIDALFWLESDETISDWMQTFETTLKGVSDVNKQDEYGNTLLVYLLCNYMNNNPDIVERVCTILMEAGIDLNRKDVWGYTALTHACNKPLPAIIRRLVDAGADVNSRDTRMMTPLHHLVNCVKLDDEMIEWMVSEAGADVNAQCEYGYTPMMMLILRMRCPPDLEYSHRECVISSLDDSLLCRIIRATDMDPDIMTRRGESVTFFMTPTIKAWFDAEMNSYILK